MVPPFGIGYLADSRAKRNPLLYSAQNGTFVLSSIATACAESAIDDESRQMPRVVWR